MRDYRRYLSSDPIPADALEVKVELDELVEAQKEEIKRAAAHPQFPSPKDASGNQFSGSGSSHYTRPSTGKQSSYAEENFYDKFDSYKVLHPCQAA